MTSSQPPPLQTPFGQGPLRPIPGRGGRDYSVLPAGPTAQAPPGAPPAPPTLPHEQQFQQRRDRHRRRKGEARREFRKEITAWRPVLIWVGTVSATTEIGLGMPPLDGALLRGVGLRLRTTHSPNSTNYWTVGVYLRDKDGDAVLVPGSEETTVSQEFPAHIDFAPYRSGSGIRVQAFHEPTVLLTKTGSPDALSGVQLQGDWFVGI